MRLQPLRHIRVVEQMKAAHIGKGCERGRHGARRNRVGLDGIRYFRGEIDACTVELGAPMAKALIAIAANAEPIPFSLPLPSLREISSAIATSPLNWRGLIIPS